MSLFHQSCQPDDDTKIDKQNDDKSPLTIQVENYLGGDTEKLFLTISANSKEANRAKVDIKGGVPFIDNLKEAEKLGLLDTFYFAPGASSISIPLEKGQYFIQVFNNKLEKSFEEIDHTTANNLFSVPIPKSVGHLRIQTAQTSIIGTEMDSCIVLVFNGSPSIYNHLDSIQMDSVNLNPLYQDTTWLGTYAPSKFPEHGIAYFHNLPVNNYNVVFRDWGKVFSKRYVGGRNLEAVKAVKDSITFYRLALLR